MNDVVLILLGAGVPIIIWVLLKFFVAGKKKLTKIKTYPIDKRNKKKEIDLLNNLLQDIKNNTYHWTYTGYNHMSNANTSVINDVKNIAIVLGDTTLLRTASALTINFGLKDITKYRHHSDDNITIHMRGKHVTDFCVQMEDALDSRGHELDFFKEQIKNKL